MVLPTSAEFVFIYHGALSLGAIPVTVNTLSAARELEYYLHDAGCMLAIGAPEVAEPLSAAAAAAGCPTYLAEPDAFTPESTQQNDERADGR